MCASGRRIVEGCLRNAGRASATQGPRAAAHTTNRSASEVNEERRAMSAAMNIAFFGSSLVSAYWNGAATYYRGLLRAMAARGHRITFYESDAFDRQKHRDLPTDPDYATVVIYSHQGTDQVRRCLDAAR